MINISNLEQAKKEIKKSLEAKERPIIVKSQTKEFNRRILEYGKFDILLDIESSSENKNKPRELDSGLNQVLANIATRNKIALGINLEEIRKLEKKKKAIIIGRIMQNIRICRKSKTKIKLLNYKDKRDAIFLLISLGASTQQAKDAIV